MEKNINHAKNLMLNVQVIHISQTINIFLKWLENRFSCILDTKNKIKATSLSNKQI